MNLRANVLLTNGLTKLKQITLVRVNRLNVEFEQNKKHEVYSDIKL